jgi:hypothetical protein
MRIRLSTRRSNAFGAGKDFFWFGWSVELDRGRAGAFPDPHDPKTMTIPVVASVIITTSSEQREHPLSALCCPSDRPVSRVVAERCSIFVRRTIGHTGRSYCWPSAAAVPHRQPRLRRPVRSIFFSVQYTERKKQEGNVTTLLGR